MKELFKKVCLEMKWLCDEDIDCVFDDLGINCISGLVEWDKVEDSFSDVSEERLEEEIRDFIRSEIYSDEELNKMI